jgi:hypothetical protein
VLPLLAAVLGAGTPFLLSLSDPRGDLAYSSLSLLVASVFCFVALAKKRVLLLALASALMVLVIGVQYFAKLSNAVHWGILCVGFGVVLLVGAVLYERRLKSALARVEGWEL